MSKVSLFVCAAILICSVAGERPLERVRYEWTHVNFTWPSYRVYREALENGEYVVENNPLVGIKIWKDRLYSTVPRWKRGVPATLISVPLLSAGDRSPNVQPYPNWEMQKIGDCSALQFVQGMEIDPRGRMWVIDTGRVAILEDSPRNDCPGRLIVFDLEDHGKILLNYEFPDDVAGRTDAYLNDIVLEHGDGGWAYITDTSDKNPGIIVFSMREKKSWKVTHRSMYATAPEFTVKHDGTKVTRPLNVDSLALSSASSGFGTLYYSPLSSLEMFSVATGVLKRNVSVDGLVEKIGDKPSQSDGMVMTSDDVLYFGLLADNVVASWNTTERPFERELRVVFREDELIQWPDTFAIDADGGLWCTSNRLQTFLNNVVDVGRVNYRVLKLADLGVKNYQYRRNGDSLILPVSI